MKRYLGLFISLILSVPVLAQQEKKNIETPIIGFFNGLSLHNADTIKYYSAKDFLLLEHGEVWNMDTLLNKVMPGKSANLTRINKFEFIRKEIKGNIA